jgi:hypothetical protein
MNKFVVAAWEDITRLQVKVDLAFSRRTLEYVSPLTDPNYASLKKKVEPLLSELKGGRSGDALSDDKFRALLRRVLERAATLK